MERINNKKSDKLLKKLGVAMKVLRPPITFEDARHYSNYSSHAKTFEDIVEEKQRSIDEQIEKKMGCASKKINIPFRKDQLPLYNALKKEYESRGFDVFFLDSSILPQLKDSNYMFISWDKPAKEEEEYLK